MKELAVALKIIKDRYRPILENQEELVCLFDINYRIKEVNDAYCRCFKKSHDELIGINILDFVPKSEHKLVQKKNI